MFVFIDETGSDRREKLDTVYEASQQKHWSSTVKENTSQL